MSKTMTATEARKNFYTVLKSAAKPGMAITITLQGQSPVVMMSADEFEGWMETLEIMSDVSLDKDVRAGIKEMKSGKRPKDTIDLDTLKKELKL